MKKTFPGIGLWCLIASCSSETHENARPGEADAARPADGQQGRDVPIDAARPVSDARVVDAADTRGAQIDTQVSADAGRDAAFSEDSAAAQVDGSVSDAEVAGPITVSSAWTVTTPTVSRDDRLAQVCVPLAPGKPEECLPSYCVSAVQDFEIRAQGTEQLRCPSDCYPTSSVYRITSAVNGYGVDFELRFRERVAVTSTTQALRDRLSFVAGSGLSLDQDSDAFYGEPADVELLELVGGRLHIRGWGKVFMTNVLQPTVPYVCPSEHTVHICTWTQCDYRQPGGNPEQSQYTGYAWMHYDVEAPITDMP